MRNKRVLWLDDQYEDYIDYASRLFRDGYLVAPVKSVSEAEKRIKEEKNYSAIIVDLKVLPGDDEKWIKLDEKKRNEAPHLDTYLGLELLRSLLKPDEAEVKLEPPIKIDPKKIVVFSVAYFEKKEISSLGIPGNQILNKSASELETLPGLIEQMEMKVNVKKILWLEDQYEDLIDYTTSLYRFGYLVDPVKSISDAEEKLRKKDYTAVIIDFKVLPGDYKKWEELDDWSRRENPQFDPYLGLELLRSLFNPEKSKVKLEPPIKIDPKKVIVFSVVNDKDVYDELISMHIPEVQIVYKSSSDMMTLPDLLEKMQNEE